MPITPIQGLFFFFDTVQHGENKKDLDDLRQCGEDKPDLDATRELIFDVMQKLIFAT